MNLYMLYGKKNIDLLVIHFALKRNLGADYMRRAGPVNRAGSVCRNLGTSGNTLKINLVCDYMEKSQPCCDAGIPASRLGADYMSRTGSVEGLALSAEMTAQPCIT